MLWEERRTNAANTLIAKGAKPLRATWTWQVLIYVFERYFYYVFFFVLVFILSAILERNVITGKIRASCVLLWRAESGQQTADNRRQTTDGRQQTVDSRQQTADSRPHVLPATSTRFWSTASTQEQNVRDSLPHLCATYGLECYKDGVRRCARDKCFLLELCSAGVTSCGDECSPGA
jgi:hypothetical protein